MSFKKKIENYWYHHKFPTLLGLAILIAAIVLVVDVVNKVDYDLAVVYVGSEYMDHISFKPIEQEVANAAGDADGNGETHIRFSTMVMPEVPQNDMDLAKGQQFNYTFLDSSARVYLCEKQYFEAKSKFFMPLDDILPADMLEGAVMRDGKAIAVSINGHKTLEELGMDTQKMYIGIRARTHEDKKDEFISEREQSSVNVLKYFVK